ncbi:glycosyltransferase [Solwaraspora sp. WMMD406]|uniref:glycosyltransferase n=1 Tax=Solwaraspora sp. WMMD406 TaxID=3016095 RepID=UPI0024162958|nr:glycosyltransferase [Solwaraspora sp. WMMD406]MDG4765959.1 glycosyltransferase [Solwaraspora sp. WMMD406]
MTQLADRRVALVHEWVGATGGSEQVFRHIAAALPHADRFVLWKDPDVTDAGLRESWLARTPLRHSKTLALPVMPLVWRTLTRRRYDVVVSSSHAFAHTVRLGAAGHTRHLSYVHSPARYVWSPDFDGRGSGPLLALPRRALRTADVRLSRHVDSYAANSHEVRARIRRFWRRDAVVIHPPVDVDYFAAAPPADTGQSRDYLLGVGRWIPYKRFDLIISIAAAAGLPVIIAGSGPEEHHLRRHADRVGARVTFEVRPDRERLRQLYWGARALLFPVHEDFGIIPVEAQACGTPVLGLARGGLLETVVDTETGFLVDSTGPEDYLPALHRIGQLDQGRIQAHAKAFSAAEFTAKLGAWIDDACP